MGDYQQVILNVEVCQKRESSLSSSEIEKEMDEYIKRQDELVLNKVIHDAVLPLHVKYFRFCSNDEKYKMNLSGAVVKKIYHIYQTWDDGPEVDTFSQENEEVPASVVWCLPNAAFEGLWESIFLDNDLKERLMAYVQTTLLYSSKQVNAQFVHWNGLVLLYGPPGTGKTTLCKALAQKLSIRLTSRYKTSQLIEINSHSLFSKWFSESAKLVLKLFTSIKERLQSKDHFVCILIDEVESLTHDRKAKGSEPSDSIRVVNAVLTQIDQLQRYPNFLILSTSNVTEAIDNAFADRADLKLFVPYPSQWAVYEIYTTCLQELINCDLVKGSKNDILEADVFRRMLPDFTAESEDVTEILENSRMLCGCSLSSAGFSGRSLRKIPFLTSTRFVNREIPTVGEFLKVMEKVIKRHRQDAEYYVSNGILVTKCNYNL